MAHITWTKKRIRAYNHRDNSMSLFFILTLLTALYFLIFDLPQKPPGIPASLIIAGILFFLTIILFCRSMLNGDWMGIPDSVDLYFSHLEANVQIHVDCLKKYLENINYFPKGNEYYEHRERQFNPIIKNLNYIDFQTLAANIDQIYLMSFCSYCEKYKPYLPQHYIIKKSD